MGKLITMNGDKFILSIPTASQFDAYLQCLERLNTWNTLNIPPWTYTEDSFLWKEYSPTDGMVIQSTYYDDPERNNIQDPEAKYRLRFFLTPLTRQGAPDSCFDSREGELASGGYILVDMDAKKRQSPDFQPKKYQVKATTKIFIGTQEKQVKPMFVDEDDEIIIVEEVSKQTMQDQPLRWMVVQGGLFCIQPLLKCKMSALEKLELLPT